MRKKIGALLPPLLFFLLLAFAGIIAITQESEEEDFDSEELAGEEVMYDEDFFAGDELDEEELPPVWLPPGPPRWFRSNAGGMALEESPSRLSALRNKYALVIDYVGPDELDSLLEPFFTSDYNIEIRVLYEEGRESRRQWLFRDEAGIARLNAVFRYEELEVEDEKKDADAAASDDEPPDTADLVLAENEAPESDPAEIAAVDPSEPDAADAAKPAVTVVIPVGFIEIFNENSQITSDYLYLENGEEMLTTYFYNGSTLVKSESEKWVSSGGSGEYQKIYTDNYRYNRSFSLRHVERLYHAAADAGPVRLLFPYRVLDAAADANFLSEKLVPGSDFLGEMRAGEGFRVIYETDSRGRILSQTLINRNEEEVWVINNIWSGDRIAAVKKTEGDDEWITEYDYDGEGKRIEQRDIRNGMLERLVRINGDKETEELYINGIAVLRAYWEDGRKISEERIRR